RTNVGKGSVGTAASAVARSEAPLAESATVLSKDRSRHDLLAVPLHGPPQPFFEIDASPVTQPGFGFRYIGQRVLNVSPARGTVFHLARIRRQRLQCLEGFVQCHPASGRHVENFSRRLRSIRFAGQQIGIDGVVYVCEIATLLAISENRGLL